MEEKKICRTCDHLEKKLVEKIGPTEVYSWYCELKKEGTGRGKCKLNDKCRLFPPAWTPRTKKNRKKLNPKDSKTKKNQPTLFDT